MIKSYDLLKKKKKNYNKPEERFFFHSDHGFCIRITVTGIIVRPIKSVALAFKMSSKHFDVMAKHFLSG